MLTAEDVTLYIRESLIKYSLALGGLVRTCIFEMVYSEICNNI